MVHIQVQLTEARISTLKRLAIDPGVSMAELIRRSVGLFVRTSGLVDYGQQRSRALSASDRFHSGSSDIAATHDEYLDEAFRS